METFKKEEKIVKQKGVIGTIIIIFLALILILVLSLMFIAKPYKVSGDKVTPPFKLGQYVLSEKITYLFKKPQLGDRVIFLPQNRDIDFVGLITAIQNQGDITTYTIVSGGNGRPWTISADKISSKIYYPFLSPQETTAHYK